MEIHPPHHRIDNWRDALVHIALITVGLLIALGLEAVVEWVHHRHQRHEALRAINTELEVNRASIAASYGLLRAQIVGFQSNLTAFKYLQAHPGTPEDQLPTAIIWTTVYEPTVDSAWRTAHETGVVAYLDPADVQRFADLYRYFQRYEAAHAEYFQAVLRARAYQLLDWDVAHLARAEVDREVEWCKDIFQSQYTLAVRLADLHRAFPDFAGPVHGTDLYAEPIAETAALKLKREELKRRMAAAAKTADSKAGAGKPAP